MTEDHDEVRCQDMAESDLENLGTGIPRTCCVCAGHDCEIARGERRKHPEFKGKIPPIAEKEKRGKKVKIPKCEEYILEITSKCGLSIDPNSNVEFNISTDEH